MDTPRMTTALVLLTALSLLDGGVFVDGRTCHHTGVSAPGGARPPSLLDVKYHVIYEKATYDEAHALCQQQELVLPMPKTEKENLELFAATTYHNFFLGLAMSAKEDWRGFYQWADGKVAEWTHFASGGIMKKMDCVLFQKKFVRKGQGRAQWVSGSCFNRASVVVCQDPSITTEVQKIAEDVENLLSQSTEPVTVLPSVFAKCARGWQKFGTSHCVKLLKHQEFQSWEEGREACKALGADLAIPRTDGQEKQLEKIYKKKGACATFIGVVRTHEGVNQWKGVDGSAIHYSDWTIYEPNNNSGRPAPLTNENCVEVWWRDGPGCPKVAMPAGSGWNDVPCELGRPKASAACMKRRGA